MKRSFTFYHQHDNMDCGPACLRMVAKYYGKSYSLQSLRDKCHITRQGVSMLGISDAAESIGLRSCGVKLTWDQLKREATLPCIVHWNQNHFVVVYQIKSSNHKCSVKVADPASGLLEYDENSFLNSWLPKGTDNGGLALLLEPSPLFYKEEGDQSSHYGFAHVLGYFRPYKSYIIQIMLAMLIASIISLLLPFITQSIVDTGISNGNIPFIIMLLIAQLALAMGSLANNMIRSWLMLHTTARVSISLISDFLCKLMKLPIAFFDSRMVGDIMQRIGDYNRIQSFLTGSLLSMVVAAVSFIIYGMIMAGYNSLIFIIFIFGSLLYVLWVLAFMKRRKKLDYMRFQQASANQNSIVQLVYGMQDIKLNNCEKQKRWDWEKIQAKLFKIGIKSLSLGQIQEAGSTFIDQTKNILISFIAAKSVIDGNMTLGMMMALQYIMGQINAPISQFISFAQAAQDASISIERLGEIHDMKDEEPEDETRLTMIPNNAPISLHNVAFQYDGPHSPYVLDNVSLMIPSGKVTAIVGASGSGKTTLLKLLLGFYKPTSGDVLLGNIKLSNYSERSWRANCGSVMQEGFIFADSITNNIAVADDSPDISRVHESAIIANIDKWINNLPLGYATKVGADGQGLSTGQKQRLLIARAAYKNAHYLFLDEATNSLDAKNEREIMENLEHFFIGHTVVVVAHRLSTVKNADNIIVLDSGKIVEQGTHQQLTSIKGVYYNLIKNQLELGQ